MRLSSTECYIIRNSSQSQAELAERFGVSQGTISNVVNYRGAYVHDIFDFSKIEPQMSKDQVAEAFGELSFEDIDMHDLVPYTLGSDELSFMYDMVNPDYSDTVEKTPQNSKIAENLVHHDYVIERKDPNGDRWRLTEEGLDRFWLEYHRCMESDIAYRDNIPKAKSRPSSSSDTFDKFQDMYGPMVKELLQAMNEYYRKNTK